MVLLPVVATSRMLLSMRRASVGSPRATLLPAPSTTTSSANESMPSLEVSDLDITIICPTIPKAVEVGEGVVATP